MYLLSVCESPHVLSVLRIIKIIVMIIKIAIPILLIISLMISFARPILSNDNDALAKEIKNSVPKIVAVVVIFMVPTFIGLIFSVADQDKKTYIGCFEDATSEKIELAFVKEAEIYMSKANETLSKADYNIALMKVKKLKNKDEKERLEQNLKTIEEKVKAKEKEEQNNYGGIFVAQPGEYIWPIQDKQTTITSCFGRDYVHPNGHGAIDIGGVGNDTRVHAAKAGTVIYPYANSKINYPNNYISDSTISINGCTGFNGCGNYVQIDHGNGIKTLYCHMSPNTILVKSGDHVEQGQVIGITGSSGCSTGSHLHFGMTSNGVKVDPLNYATLYQVTNPNRCSN